jgi:hypothetical protein
MKSNVEKYGFGGWGLGVRIEQFPEPQSLVPNPKFMFTQTGNFNKISLTIHFREDER